MPVTSIHDTRTSDSFSPEEVVNQTKRILAHPLFTNSPTLSKFLEFIISEAVYNREQQIKEYSIAINVLHRASDFNSHEDAIVRIHAGRLRRALGEYYFTLGINDPIIVFIPKGSYMPHFCRSKEEKELAIQSPPLISTESANHSIVAIFPFRVMQPSRELDEFSLELAEQIIVEFCRFPEISLIGYYSADMKSRMDENILDAGKSIGAQFILTGTIQQRSSVIRIRIHFLDTQSGRILMSKFYDEECTGKAKLDNIDYLARSIMSSLHSDEKDTVFKKT